MKKKLAFISEHASPLASLGGIDSGGQNVYVAETARELAKNGYEIDIFTRWDDPSLPAIIQWKPRIRVIHIKAGGICALPKECLLDHMAEFREEMLAFIRKEKKTYALIHAHFFMSALVAADLKKILHIPFVVTFHALGIIRRLFQRNQDAFPYERINIERRIAREADYIIAECPQDKADLVKYYEAHPEKTAIVPCGFSKTEFSYR